MTRRILLIISTALQIVISISVQPVDHLVPPPQQHRILNPRIRPSPPEPPGFMQRVARWFGFGNGPKDQQLDPSNQYPQYRDSSQAYQYHPPKAPCNLCNNVPWVPMFPGHLQYPLVKGHSNQPSAPQAQYQHNSNLPVNQYVSLPTYSSSNNVPSTHPSGYSFQPPLVQRAVKFNFPSYNILANGNGFKTDKFIPPQNLSPIPIPNLSAHPIPPLYGPVPFNRPLIKPHVKQFHLEHAEASELRTVTPTQLPPTLPITQNSESSFEIVKSVPVTDFVSSVEYPVNVIQSQIIDVSDQQKPDTNVQDFPKLIELGSYEPLFPTQSPDYVSEPIVVHNHNTEPDNYPEASSHNLTYRNENFEDIRNYISSSPEPFRSTTETTTVLHTETPFENVLNINAEVGSVQRNIEFQPSIQTASQNPESLSEKQRQTPKKLLDAPILYLQGSSPRPFTRDPSELKVRSSTYSHNLWQSSPTPTPWIFAPTPTSTYTSIDASGQFAGISPPSQFQPAPIPYPKNIEKSPKQFHQLIIPYTTKDKPRPFKPREEQHYQPENDVRYVNWSHSQEVEPHEQQESKFVMATETPSKKTTKYLTKILASNIRELLKKEYETKSKTKSSFDFSKLQKNIDEWTQQEFTSLTHKASTVSLRGRSKNIPSEYLTTTASLRQVTTTTESPPQIGTHIESLLDDQEVKKFDFLAKLIEDNYISNTENIQDSTDRVVASTTMETPVTPLYIRTVPPTPVNEPWERLKVSISPLTKEKVYVVTPQPVLQQKVTTDSVGTFKSPRFLVRPTPGSGSNKTSSRTPELVTPSYSPELFGLMGISAFIPSAPVETSDGHSKVITVITPVSDKKLTSDIDLPISREVSPRSNRNSTSENRR